MSDWREADAATRAAREIVLAEFTSRLKRSTLPSWLADAIISYGRECFRLGHLHAHQKQTIPSRAPGGFDEEEKTPIRFLWEEDEEG